MSLILWGTGGGYEKLHAVGGKNNPDTTSHDGEQNKGKDSQRKFIKIYQFLFQWGSFRIIPHLSLHGCHKSIFYVLKSRSWRD